MYKHSEYSLGLRYKTVLSSVKFFREPKHFDPLFSVIKSTYWYSIGKIRELINLIEYVNLNIIRCKLMFDLINLFIFL